MGNSKIGKQNINKQRGITGFIERCAIPSFKHLLIHTLIAITLFVILFLFVGNRVCINTSSFVPIISSIGAASGALLAVSIALATFFSRYLIDQRDRYIDKLEHSKFTLSKQMEKTAEHFPEISHRLTELFLQAAFYIQGQSIDPDEVYKASRIFDDWAK